MAPAAPDHRTLLVVEDNDVSREGLAVVLRRAGYHVVPAANGEEALRLLKAGPPPDLILLDMLMPVLDGWHFLERLRRKGPCPPVIVTTAAGVLSLEWAQDHGCAGFLRKPVETDELLAEGRRCLAAASL
jgi:CheY-like chemotaxis protein